MSNTDKQKPYDAQTAKFLAVISENMPELSDKDMQFWIETKNRRALQYVLAMGLVRPSDMPHRFLPQNGNLLEPMQGEWSTKSIELEPRGIQYSGTNPLDLTQCSVDLDFSIQYVSFSNRTWPVVRPWLSLYDGNLGNKVVWVPANDVLGASGQHSLNVAFDATTVISLFQKAQTLPELLLRLEHNYVNKVADYIKDACTSRLSVEETGDGWTIRLHLLKAGASWFITRFRLTKRQLAEAMEQAQPIDS
ncbi:MAG: hypothetical protein KGI71_02920 [Patescibacteria group bacterium]|nr:hypothetical protein [Patescibacteria group bacterium]